MTDNTKNVDWTQPVEAVHEDGRVLAVTIIGNDGGNMPWCVILAGGLMLWSFPDGETGTGWAIRNVAEAKADEWGPEIKVEGKRPEWLGDDGKQVVAYNRRLSDHWFGMSEGGSTFYIRDIEEAGDGNGWADVTAIRLPANHPHYAQNAPETHRQGTNGVRTSQECLERMEALVRRMAVLSFCNAHAEVEEARAIVRDLPEPADPDLVEARELVCECVVQFASNDTEATLLRLYRAGEGDNEPEVQKIYAAIKRGRALERGEN